MANPEHVEIVKQGAEAIRQWRENNPSKRLNLSEANLHGANLHKANLSGANLTKANFSGAYISEVNLWGVNLSGVNLWSVNLSGLDLGGADLGGADLSGANLHKANLSGANLSGVNLRGVNLSGLDLGGADLSGADLSEADLSEADLSEANLSGVNLVDATLSNATLHNARLDDAILDRTRLDNVDLSDASGLQEVVHKGASTLGFDTLQRSGELPDVFLTGCGLPQDWVDALQPVIRAIRPIQFYSCFISYSGKDESFCKRLHSQMRDEGLRVWFAPEEMKAGRKIHEQIDEAIRVYEKLVLVLSKDSMSSKWVANEIREAFKLEQREDKRMLFPIGLVPFSQIEDWKLIDSRTGTDLAEEIRQYFIPDFSNWKDHDAFEAAFKRLLDDLKAEADRDETGDGTRN